MSDRVGAFLIFLMLTLTSFGVLYLSGVVDTALDRTACALLGASLGVMLGAGMALGHAMRAGGGGPRGR